VLVPYVRCQRKNTLGYTQSPKLENPADNYSHVGSFEEEHPETYVPIFAAKKEYSACSIVLPIVVSVVVSAAARVVEHLDAHIRVA
jgi:hypothetical protein